MEYIAIAKNIKSSPRKMRLIADSVKNQNLKTALLVLTVMNKISFVEVPIAYQKRIGKSQIIGNFFDEFAWAVTIQMYILKCWLIWLTRKKIK